MFSRFVEKRRSRAGEGLEVSIYSWNRRRSFKAFPVSMYSTGTVILFSGGEPLRVFSNPMPKALDYQQALEILSPDAVPFLASRRVDGWQVNVCYDDLPDRWILSTRFVLHNMYFSVGRLRVDTCGEISNPIAALADAVARERGLYRSLEGLEGWTFTFSLAGPEPASVAPRTRWPRTLENTIWSWWPPGKARESSYLARGGEAHGLEELRRAG